MEDVSGLISFDTDRYWNLKT
jgi:hypothetical protein